MLKEGPTSWKVLCREVDAVLKKGRARLVRARYEEGKREVRRVEDKIRKYEGNGVVFSPEPDLVGVKKKLKERKYDEMKKHLEAVENRVERIVSDHNSVTPRLKELFELKERTEEAGLEMDEERLERVEGMYRSGGYSAVSEELKGLKGEAIALLDKHKEINTAIEDARREVEEEKNIRADDIESMLGSALRTLLEGDLDESERKYGAAYSLLKKRREERRARWKPVEGNIRYLIPDHTITHTAGVGASATVYKGIDRDGEPVAIKLPRFLHETVSTATLEQFKAEADIWKNLEHENIVGYIHSDIRPCPYLVIELMEGGDLKERMELGTISVREGIDIMIGILDGVSYAHRMACVHRDLKPENILFTPAGTPKISDWGIGKFMASESARKTRGTKGTLLYSAPEQISKKEYGGVDWSTDIFQLGILFYEMLTGINPFHDKDAGGIITKILNQEVRAPSAIRPEIPPELDAVIMRALEKRKEDRWRSADVMYEELMSIGDARDNG